MTETSHILITDDEPRICKLISSYLNSKSYFVKTAGSTGEARMLLDECRFDLLIVDKQMPGEDGFQLMEEFLTRQPDSPVIMMTGDATVDSAIQALKMGAYDYLKKPFELDELDKTVKNALTQKKLEEENVKISSQLIHTEKRFQDMIESSPDLIFSLDHDSRFNFTNKTFKRILGYDALSLKGQCFLDIVHPEDKKEAKEFIKSLISDPSSEKTCDIRLLGSHSSAHDRKSITVEMKPNAEIHGTSADDPQKLICIVARDISIRKEMEEKLWQAQKMEAIGTLAGGIAHNFNNLLMGIQGYTSLLLVDMPQNSPQHKKLSTIEKCIQSGSHMTRELLNFARKDRSKQKAANLNGIIKETAELFSSTRKDLDIIYKLEENLWPVDINSGQIEQVLLNLLVNSVQAMPVGGTITISTENKVLGKKRQDQPASASGKHTVITISDTGVGMEQETMKQIFDPFFTTKGKSNGTGLGLSSAYGIIKSHNGTIEVSSDPNAGSTFKIYLKSGKSKAIRESKQNDMMFARNETILIIDDEIFILNTLSEILQQIGCRVLTAKDGREGIKTYMENQQDIDLVILDLIMPGISASDTYDYIRTINKDARVLLSSGYSCSGEVESLLKKGCNGFIQKPFNINEISRKINSITGQRFDNVS